MPTIDYRSSNVKVIIVSILILAFSTIVLLDSYLPTIKTHTTVIDKIAYATGGKVPRTVHGIVTPDGRIPVPYYLYADIAKGDSVIIEESPIVHFASNFYYRKYTYPQSANVYIYHKIPLFVILFGSLFCLIKRKDSSGLVYFFISITLLFSLILFAFFIDDIYVAPS